MNIRMPSNYFLPLACICIADFIPAIVLHCLIPVCNLGYSNTHDFHLIKVYVLLTELSIDM
jgi:hypothetical protein